MLTAILISGAMMTLSSCSKDDDQTGPGPLAEKLSGGTWYCIYEAWGVAEEDGPGSAEAAYCVVVDIITSNQMGLATSNAVSSTTKARIQ